MPTNSAEVGHDGFSDEYTQSRKMHWNRLISIAGIWETRQRALLPGFNRTDVIQVLGDARIPGMGQRSFRQSQKVVTHSRNAREVDPTAPRSLQLHYSSTTIGSNRVVTCSRAGSFKVENPYDQTKDLPFSSHLLRLTAVCCFGVEHVGRRRMSANSAGQPLMVVQRWL